MNFSNAAAQLNDLQKDLYQKAYSEAQAYTTVQAKALGRYGSEFYRCLPQRFSLSSLAKINNRISRSNIILYGDFHTLRQSQRGLLRLIRSFHQSQPDRKIAIAMEMFSADDQLAIDAYIAGDLSEEQFLSDICYEDSWGFPFQNYSSILQEAKNYGFKVIGVNASRVGSKNSILSRDSLIAGNLTEVMKKLPDHLVFCLIGEFHIADLHLPSQLKQFSEYGESLDICRIVTNVDSYYFKLPTSKVSGQSEYLELAEDFFCIMNTSPWIKWQSLANWELLKQVGCNIIDSSQDDDSLDDFNEDGIDIEYHIIYLAKELAKFLAIDTADLSLDRVYSHLLSEDQKSVTFKFDSNRCSYDLLGIVNRVQLDGFYYYPPTYDVVLSKLSLNHLSTIAGQHLQAVGLISNIPEPYDEVTKFYFEVLKVAAGVFSVKTLNPKRKSPDLNDYIEFVNKTSRKRLIGPGRIQRENSRNVLKHHQLMVDFCEDFTSTYDLEVRLAPLLKFNFSHSGILVQSIGGVLGLHLYHRAMETKLSLDQVRRLFKLAVSSRDSLLCKTLEIYKLIL